MTGTPDEKYFEEYIERYLTSQPITTIGGDRLDRMEYHSVAPTEYDKKLCMIPSELIAFLKETQPQEYKELIDITKSEERAQKSILERLDSEMKYGTLRLLNRNATFQAGYGVSFRLAYFRPANGKNAEFEQQYYQNRLAVVRQLRYSVKKDYEIDMAIFVNGIPVFTIELKNTLTGQKHINAIRQYMKDRPTKGEKLLEFKRCLAHFAVGTEQIFMTTKLADDKTKFLPFNDGFENANVKARGYDGYLTSYFWEDVLRRDSLLDLIDNFITVKEEEEKIYDPKTGDLKTETHEVLIFPRFHQRRAVEHLVEDAKQRGAGHRYLIQHSAGSGKSNTITWLGYKLAYLYQHYEDDKPLFDSVIVVTDRRVLDRQTQRNFKQFEQVEGEAKMVAEDQTSQDLKKYIENRERIIVTTLQKFSVIAGAIEHFPDRKYAVIIDEAHSSQTGEAARDMRKALSLAEAEKFDEDIETKNNGEDYINRKVEQEIAAKGQKGNISFFAFTATPKPRTIELFTERVNGKREPFDKYSTEEAINEGFILNVLENYMSFKRYYRLVKRTDIPDKEYSKKKSIKLLNSYVDLQDAAIERKARIMIEHFMTQTADEIQGKARAMLVTRSRLHAVRFKLKFDEIMQEMHLPYGSLVAFSGTVHDGETDMDYTEFSMNHLEGKYSIPEALKLPKYRILIVANKYQTGFDEPMLHTMFVDKKLGGTSTVQTLSRLNRTMSGKTSTMVLDFVNDPEDVKKDCQDYYGINYMLEEDETDPNSLYDLMSEIKNYQVFTQNDVNEFAKYAFVDVKHKEKVYVVVNRVCDYINSHLEADDKDSFRKKSRQFCNIYKFLSQIISFKDVELEKLYVFLLAIIKAMPFEKDHIPYEILLETQLSDYKVQYQYTADLKLESADTAMTGMKPGTTSQSSEDEYDLLSKIIKTLNDTYGLNLTDEDKVDMEKMKDRLYANEELMSFFNSDNTRDNVKERFDEEVDNELLDFINTKLELYNKLTDDRANETFKRLWFNELYNLKVRGINY